MILNNLLKKYLKNSFKEIEKNLEVLEHQKIQNFHN